MQQQIAVSGLGGQGVLYVTKLLAEAALQKDLSVLVSETHGMAQRGGNVISHLKVFPRIHAPCASQGASLRSRFLTSPLIRPGRADVLLALHEEGLAAHGYLLKPGGAVFCNRSDPQGVGDLDAVSIAKDLGDAVAANLVLLGHAAASGILFCTVDDVKEALRQSAGTRLELSMKALEAGACAARRREPN
ncbi:MAG: 2-oxoacid:acceptor oxidoreductase family protein [Desulfosoma sp.]